MLIWQAVIMFEKVAAALHMIIFSYKSAPLQHKYPTVKHVIIAPIIAIISYCYIYTPI